MSQESSPPSLWSSDQDLARIKVGREFQEAGCPERLDLVNVWCSGKETDDPGRTVLSVREAQTVGFATSPDLSS